MFGYICTSLLNIDPTCFKNSKNPSCIDVLLINFKPSFMKTNVFKTVISDHSQNETHFTTSLETIIKKLSNKYKKLILTGDFNMNTSNPILSQFLDTCTFSIKYRSSLFSDFKKSRLHQSFADKFQTIFMRTNVFETDLYDHHKNDLYYHET